MSSRNIAINKTSTVAGLTLVVGQLVAFGVLPQATGDAVMSTGTIVIGAAFAVVAAVHAVVGLLIHKKVTPVADPKDNQGRMLVPAPEPTADTYLLAPTSGDNPLPDPLGMAGSDTAAAAGPPV